MVEEFFSRKSSLRAWTCRESRLSTSDACKQRRPSGAVPSRPFHLLASPFSGVSRHLSSVSSRGDAGFLPGSDGPPAPTRDKPLPRPPPSLALSGSKPTLLVRGKRPRKESAWEGDHHHRYPATAAAQQSLRVPHQSIRQTDRPTTGEIPVFSHHFLSGAPGASAVCTSHVHSTRAPFKTPPCLSLLKDIILQHLLFYFIFY